MYAVIFRATIKELDQKYSDTAERMRELAMAQYGCLDFVSMSEGLNELSISYWPDESAIRRWRQDPEHQQAQALGKELWYQDFQIEVMEMKRQYRSKPKGEGHAATE